MSEEKGETALTKKGYFENNILPPKIEVRSSTILVVEEAFLMLDEAPTDDILLAPSGPPLL